MDLLIYALDLTLVPFPHKDDTIKEGKFDKKDDGDDRGSHSRCQEHDGETLLDRCKGINGIATDHASNCSSNAIVNATKDALSRVVTSLGGNRIRDMNGGGEEETGIETLQEFPDQGDVQAFWVGRHEAITKDTSNASQL
jgi:hypothetical protein